MRENIIVIGGYGHVGQTICRQLGELYPGKVMAAGRNREKAEKFCRSTGGIVRPLRLDVSKTVDPAQLENAKLIVMCLDQATPDFVRVCMELGIHYVDISADGRFLASVESLDGLASSRKSTAVLSTGLAPGLTNLLAKYAHTRMDETEVMEITVMLGLGDQHGKAAMEWMLNRLGTRFEVLQEGERKRVASFTDGKVVEFGARLGRRKAYRFNFSDQHTIPRTLGIPTVSTRLCFDAAWGTRLLRWVRATGLYHVLRASIVRSAVIKLMSGKRLPLGTEIYAAKIDAHGKRGGEKAILECSIRGSREAEITGKIAAAVSAALYASPFPHGVFHIEQLFELEDVLPFIRKSVAMEARINGKPIL